MAYANFGLCTSDFPRGTLNNAEACDTQVACAYHCHNDGNMLIADSSVDGETQAR